MTNLHVTEVLPADVIDVVATDPERDRPVRRTTWSGFLSVAAEAATDAGPATVSLFLPDSRPFPKVAMTGVRTAARASLAGLPTTPGECGRLEVERASATITPDPRGGEHAWLELHLQLRTRDLVPEAIWRLAYVVDLRLPHRPAT